MTKEEYPVVVAYRAVTEALSRIEPSEQNSFNPRFTKLWAVKMELRRVAECKGSGRESVLMNEIEIGKYDKAAEPARPAATETFIAEDSSGKVQDTSLPGQESSF